MNKKQYNINITINRVLYQIIRIINISEEIIYILPHCLLKNVKELMKIKTDNKNFKKVLH